jgi:dTDP-4-dehydrorhamnose reductase
MKDNKKVIVLGVEGMLGRVIYSYLKQDNNLRVLGTSKRKNNNLIKFNALKIPDSWAHLIKTVGKIDFVINCIATLRSSKVDKDIFYKVNTVLPKYLEKMSLENDFKLIHFSTDAVFSEENNGPINESVKPSTNELYGKSKLEGEVANTNSLTIRTSIIGFNPIKKLGLVEWVVDSREAVNGYTNQSWAGATVLQVANLTLWLVKNKGFHNIKNKTSLLHYSPLGPVSKYDLVKNIAKMLNADLIVKKSQGKHAIKRYLISKYKNNLPKNLTDNSIENALKQLYIFENNII